jgi:signal transduction histidine kinase
VRFPTGVTILRVIAVARWLAWGWMVAVVAFSGDAVRQPSVAWTVAGCGLVLAVVSTWLLRTRPERLLRGDVVVAEAVFALAATVLDGWVFEPGHVFVTSQTIASQWPIVAALSIAVAAGPVAAAGFGVIVGPARWAAAELNGFDGYAPKHAVALVSVSVFTAATGAVAGWLTVLLRRVEGEIADRRARDEVAAVLHDTVLQTLALVERRSAAADPDLSRAARDADRELRAFLFGVAPAGSGDLRTRVRATVDHTRRLADGDGPRITTNVVDTGCRVGDRELDIMLRAVGEAVANALEHAGAANVVVFAETDDDGQVFCTVRDDGTGFEVDDRHDAGHGIQASIIGRMASIDGRAEIHSTPGRGTEVLIWSRDPG